MLVLEGRRDIFRVYMGSEREKGQEKEGRERKKTKTQVKITQNPLKMPFQSGHLKVTHFFFSLWQIWVPANMHHEGSPTIKHGVKTSNATLVM